MVTSRVGKGVVKILQCGKNSLLSEHWCKIIFYIAFFSISISYIETVKYTFSIAAIKILLKTNYSQYYFC